MNSLLARRIAVARGDEPADLVLRGGRVLSVFTREWLETDVAVADGWIAGLGEDDGRGVRPARARERARHGRRPLAPRRLRGPAARLLLHGLVVHSGVALRV